ncbi:porin [Pseudoduganella ginsengisoli]|uniref:Porin n=1 Tax=Pseudoduganella ginsengisoli TaxID=1462440 RepID=A0A6L6PWY3_9BURK|nr:porin [Pseudoduganella ginsengisoli]MTW01664.1 porin [Pseudoduganella ginsengisoli]
MNKTIVALTLAALAPCAFAETGVQFYGIIDAGLRYQTHVDAAGNSLLSMGSGQYLSNRFGFRGTEDLGGGLTARVLLEGGFNSKTGALDNTSNVLFNRTAAVGLGGAWGAIDMGRQYTIGFRTELFLDPFNHHYTGLVPLSSGAGTPLPAAATAAGLSASSSSGTRFNNDIQYTGTFGGLTVRAEYAPGEVAGDSSKGTARAAGFTYTGNGLLAAGVYTHKQTPAGFDNNAVLLGGGARYKALTVKAGWSRERQQAATTVYQNRTAFGGASYQLSAPVELTAAIYRSEYDGAKADGTRTLYLLGGSYHFSKRTNLYAEFDVNQYRGALIPASKQTSQRGVAMGMTHMF